MNQPFARAQPNNLLKFLQEISPRTKSLLLATATPVQLQRIVDGSPRPERGSATGESDAGRRC